MEGLLIVLVLFLMLAGVISFVLCLVVFSKIQKLRETQAKQEKVFETRLRDLEKKLAQLNPAYFTGAPPVPAAKATVAESTVQPPTFTQPARPLTQAPKPLPATQTPPAAKPAPASTPPPLPQSTPSQPPVQKPPTPTTTYRPPVIAKNEEPGGEAPPPKKGLDLEQWLGIRGAAVLGGIVLALAGVYLFKYSIEKNLLSPPLRVALGILTGLGCLFGSSLLRKRQFHLPANGLIGGGLVTLYGSVWAAHSLYELVHPFLAFLLMAAITLTCGLLSMRHQSRFIAMLGLFGGFATPIMVSTGEVRTFELFGYLFLLNLGVLALAKKLGQPLLAFVSLAATTAYQLFFLSQHLLAAGPETLLIILGIFGLLYILSGLLFDKQDRRWAKVRTWGSTLTLAMVGLLAFQDANLALLPLTLMLACLSAGACWIAYYQEDALLVKVASIGTFTCLWIWALSNTSPSEPAWLEALAIAGLAALYAGSVRLAERGVESAAGLKGFQFAFVVAAIAAMALLLFTSLQYSFSTSWIWIGSWLFISLLVWWQTRSGSMECANLFFGLGLGFNLAVYYLDSASVQGVQGTSALVPTLLGTGIALLFVAKTIPTLPGKLWAHRGAVLYGLLMLGAMGLSPLAGFRPTFAIIFLLALVLIAIVGAFQSNSSWLYVSLLIVGAMAFVNHCDHQESSGSWLIAYLGSIGFAVLLAYAPLLTFKSLRTKKLTWISAALAPALSFFWLWPIFENRFSQPWEWVTSFVLAGVALGGAFACHQNVKNGEQALRFGRSAFAGVAITLITIGLAIQFERSALTLAWTLESLLLLALWRRQLHPGLKWAAFGLFTMVFLRLTANPYILEYHPDSTARIFSWLMPTYLLPCLGFLWGALTLRRHEVATLSERELIHYPKKAPLLGHAMAFGVIVILFVYLNLAVVQYYGNGSLQLSFPRQSARDLTLSLVWAIYGLALMTLGIRQRATALRRISLGMVMLTICKVFLYDLGELTDLYRAASLFGLALSLLGVSVAYQKFVAGGPKSEPEPNVHNDPPVTE